MQGKDVNKLTLEMSVVGLSEDKQLEPSASSTNPAPPSLDPQPEPHPDYNHVNFWKVPLTLGTSE